MANKNETTIGIKGESKSAEQAIERTEKKVEGLSKKMKIAAGVMAAAAGAMVAGMLDAVKAAGEEEAGIVRLSTAMKNVGLSYDKSRGQLEAWIDANQQATSFADDEQRSALASMIRMTGNLEEAQKKLTLAMNVAVGTNKDLASASQLVQYAMGGNWGMVERYIPALKSVQDEQEKWRVLNELFAGQATEFGKTMAGQFKTLENNIGDLKEAFGEALLPVVQSLLEPVQTFVGFMKEHPTLTKFAAAGTAVSAALLGVSAASIMASNAIKTTLIPMMVKMVTMIWTRVIPALTAKIALLLASMAAMGPAGWVMLGIATATIAGLMVATPKLIESLTKPKKSMDIGGVVPGLPGSPVPVLARGGERFGGWPDHGGGGGGDIHIHVGAFMGKPEDARAFADMISEAQRKNNRRTTGRLA